MGLDMTLSRKTYVKNWNHMKPAELHQITVLKNGKPRKDINPEKITYIVEDVAYWRKFNALHSWFVINCQDGEDDCREHDVDKDQLKELLEDLKKIKNDHSLAESLLPTQSGFFFGGTEYDEYYFHDVEKTIEILEELFKIKNDEGEYFYCSSW